MPERFRRSDAADAVSLADAFEDGWTYDEMVAHATRNAELFRISRSRAAAPPEYAARIAAAGGRWHLLSVSEDWCGDSVNILPWVDALAGGSPQLDHRIVPRDRHLALMDRHLTNGRTRSIPIVILLDEHFVERAWWGPRPAALQAWFEGAEAQALTKDGRYKALRTWYARDRGRAVMEELAAMIEDAAAQVGPGAAGDGGRAAGTTMQAASHA